MNVAIPQLSVAVGAVLVATCEHVIVLPPYDVKLMFNGQPAITGNVLSVTVNVVVQFVAFPAASVAVKVTVVTPVVTVVPATGDCVFVIVPVPVQLSVAVNALVKSGTVAEQLAFAKAVLGAVQFVITGAV